MKTEIQPLTADGGHLSYRALLDQAMLAARNLDETLLDFDGGLRTPRGAECFSKKIGDKTLCIGLDSWESVSDPVISISFDDPDSRIPLAQIFISPEVASRLCVLVPQLIPRVLNLPTGVAGKPEEISDLDAVPNASHGDLLISTRCIGLRRDLMLEQPGVDRICLHPLELQDLVWGLIAALKALDWIHEI